MASSTTLTATADHTAPLVPVSAGARIPSDDLAERIAALAAQLHAATYELLVLLRQFDATSEWRGEFATSAHWLHWRTGISLGAAREKLRVARALVDLPRVSAKMSRGAISYAKVRALTRVATPENEAALLDFAQAATAAHVERFVGAWRSVDRVTAAERGESRHHHRELCMWVDDDGMLVLRARLAPEEGALVQRALQAATDRLWVEDRALPKGDPATEVPSASQRRADALALIAEAALTADMSRSASADRYQVVLHVGAHAGVAAAEALAETVETDQGLVDVSAETPRRLGCDASVVAMRLDGGGDVLDIGRKTRTVPASMRRALHARDAHCQFPGCTARICDAHHVEHWIDGGTTSLRQPRPAVPPASPSSTRRWLHAPSGRRRDDHGAAAGRRDDGAGTGAAATADVEVGYGSDSRVGRGAVRVGVCGGGALRAARRGPRGRYATELRRSSALPRSSLSRPAD